MLGQHWWVFRVQTLEVSFETQARTVGTAVPSQSTIGGEIRRLAELQPHHAAVVGTGFDSLSYRELQCLADEVRAALRLAGLGGDARIAISMPDGPQAALAIVTVACSAVSIPLNPKQTLTETESRFAAIRPDAVLVAKGTDSPAKGIAERKGLTVIELTQSKEGNLAFSIAGVKAGTVPSAAESGQPNADTLALILQTSGTSAEPKLIPISHRNVLITAARVQAWYNLTPYDRCLSVSPVFYAHGLKVTIFSPLLAGGSIAFPQDASKFDIAEWFGALKPTWFSAGPTLHRLLFDQIGSRVDADAAHSLRFVTAGLALLPPDVQDGLQRALGVPVLACCGASEASVIATNQPPPGRSKLGTVGIPWPDAVIVVGDDGGRLPPGEKGELLVSGPTVISGYLDAPELNRVSFVDGWFKTGDIGSLDNDGFLTLHGRKDDLINRGGEKISPVEIDDALMQHPAIVEAAAFAVPHRRLGQDIAAAVVLRPGVTLRPEELRGYLRHLLTSFKIPRRIIICDQLPKGQTGKIVRRNLTELLAKPATEIRGAVRQPIADAIADSDLVFELTEIWERLLKIAPLSPDDDFFENGGDSLLAMEMLAELEALTGQAISGSILFEASTILQLVHRLTARRQFNEKPKPVIRLNASGSQTPLFFFHSDVNGEGYAGIRPARLLGSDQPFFVVAPHGVSFDPVPSSIEAMAAERLPLILNAQPEGPYRLCGSCIGGIIAFEVARRLIAAGKEVDIVVMVDPPTINARTSIQLLFSIMRLGRPLGAGAVDRAMAWTFRRCADLERFWNRSWMRRWAAIGNRVRKLASGGIGQVRLTPIVADRHSKGLVKGTPMVQARAERDKKYEVALSNYAPKSLAVRVIYFSVVYGGGGVWRRISPDLEIIKLPGDHYNFDVADVAQNLRARLHGEAVDFLG
jgi:acyl-CoA synthetase (AMP-forming)/AMP-acid ligase II